MFVATEKSKEFFVGNMVGGGEVYAFPSVLAAFGKEQLRPVLEDGSIPIREIDENTCAFNLIDKDGNRATIEMFSAEVKGKGVTFFIDLMTEY